MRLAMRHALLVTLFATLAVSACDTTTDSGGDTDSDGADDTATDADAVSDVDEVAEHGWDDDAPLRWSVLISDEAPDAVAAVASQVVGYLDLMGRTVTLETVSRDSAADEPMPTDCVAEEGRVYFVGDGVGEDFNRSSGDNGQTWEFREESCAWGFAVALDGGGLLGRQYAAYEWLHSVGVRFFHPEFEYVPSSLYIADGRAGDSIAGPRTRRHTPDFHWRSVSLHLTHPLELGDIYREGIAEYEDEGVRYIDWQLKNLASYGHGGFGSGEYRSYGHDRGFIRTAGFALHNQQQGASNIIDPDDPRSEEEQIAEAIDARMGSGPDYPALFQFTFNASEFTEIPDEDIVRQLTFIADYFAENYPDTLLQCINHGTAGEPTPNYGVRFYDLPKFAPNNLGVSVHTLMFYDLFRPAPVYGNEDFNYLYDFMVEEYRDRRLWYYPESAWWLTFDIAVPLYLPITIEARDRDIQSIAFMLEGGLDGHRVFGSGHEWGYWQNEYCSLRMAADLSYRYTDCLDDITAPLGSGARDVRDILDQVIQSQERDFIYGDTLAWLVGTDPETEVAASIGFQFHPLPPSASQIMRWTLDEVDTWQGSILPALQMMDDDYTDFVARLREVVVDGDPEAQPILDEIIDGVEVTGLRARHAWQVYGAAVLARQAQLLFDSGIADLAADLLEEAKQTTEDAIAVVRRREQGYRYEPIERSIGGGPAQDEDDNWTIYKYRYLNRTHHGYYYTRIDDQVEEALSRSPALFEIEDTVIEVGEELRVVISDPTRTGEIVDFGDGGGPVTGNTSDPIVVTNAYDDVGTYDVDVEIAHGDDIDVFSTAVAVVSNETHTGFSATIIEPAGAALIEGVLPALVVGPMNDSVVVGFSSTPDHKVRAGLWTAAQGLGDGLNAQTGELIVPVINRSSGNILTSLLVSDVTLTEVDDTLEVAGNLDTDAIVRAVVAVGGFEISGARSIVASTLGYTVNTLPADVPFLVRWTIEP